MTQNSNFSSDYIISDEVLATIAVNAVKDVDGVSGFGNRPPDLYSTFKIGAEDLKHVAIAVSDYDIKVHIYIMLTSSAKIHTVSTQVQKAVKQAIQNMTGRVVTRVDVTVCGVSNESVEKDSNLEPKNFTE